MKRMIPYWAGLPLLLLLLSVGCVPEESAVPYKEVYVFDRIEYFLTEQDGSFDRESETRTAGGTNYTSGTGVFTFYPLINIDESSLFSTDALKTRDFEVPEGRLIPIPQEIDDRAIILSEPKALFNIFLPQYFSGDWNGQKVNLYIPPHSDLEYDYTIRYKELKVSFRATFTEKEYRKELVVEGEWEGTRILGSEGKSTVTPIPY